MPATDGGPSAAGAWTFTDDRGVTITLPERPERIVGYVGTAGHGTLDTTGHSRDVQPYKL